MPGFWFVYLWSRHTYTGFDVYRHVKSVGVILFSVHIIPFAKWFVNIFYNLFNYFLKSSVNPLLQMFGDAIVSAKDAFFKDCC